MKKNKKRREEEGIQGERKKKKKDKKKNLLLALNRSGYICWCPVCATGGGGEGLDSLFSLPGSHSSLFCRCGPWQSIRPLISHSSSFVLGTRKWRLQPLWLGKHAHAARESSRFGFVTYFVP